MAVRYRMKALSSKKYIVSEKDFYFLRMNYVTVKVDNVTNQSSFT